MQAVDFFINDRWLHWR